MKAPPRVPISVGMTGTLEGMSGAQLAKFEEIAMYLTKHYVVEAFHDGMAIGSDEEGLRVFKGLGIWTVGHPPTDQTRMTKLLADLMLPPLPFKDRNRAVVDSVNLLLVTPLLIERSQPRSGTWATKRYAEQRNTPRLIIWRDGDVKQEGPWPS